MPTSNNNSFIICVQTNLHKKAESSTDLLLYLDYLLKGYHVDNSCNIVRGMKPFRKKFSYKKRDSTAKINDFLIKNVYAETFLEE